MVPYKVKKGGKEEDRWMLGYNDCESELHSAYVLVLISPKCRTVVLSCRSADLGPMPHIYGKRDGVLQSKRMGDRAGSS